MKVLIWNCSFQSCSLLTDLAMLAFPTVGSVTQKFRLVDSTFQTIQAMQSTIIVSSKIHQKLMKTSDSHQGIISQLTFNYHKCSFLTAFFHYQYKGSWHSHWDVTIMNTFVHVYSGGVVQIYCLTFYIHSPHSPMMTSFVQSLAWNVVGKGLCPSWRVWSTMGCLHRNTTEYKQCNLLFRH